MVGVGWEVFVGVGLVGCCWLRVCGCGVGCEWAWVVAGVVGVVVVVGLLLCE